VGGWSKGRGLAGSGDRVKEHASLARLGHAHSEDGKTFALQRAA
jgi:hypothetical protein